MEIWTLEVSQKLNTINGYHVFNFLYFSLVNFSYSTHKLYLCNCSVVFGELNLFNSILICFILKEKCAVSYWSQLMVVNCKFWNLSLMINTIQQIDLFCDPFRMALRPVADIEVILDSFLCTVAYNSKCSLSGHRSCEQLLEIQDADTTGPSMAACHRILGDMIQRAVYLEELPWLERESPFIVE